MIKLNDQNYENFFQINKTLNDQFETNQIYCDL